MSLHLLYFSRQELLNRQLCCDDSSLVRGKAEGRGSLSREDSLKWYPAGVSLWYDGEEQEGSEDEIAPAEEVTSDDIGWMDSKNVSTRELHNVAIHIRRYNYRDTLGPAILCPP